MHKKEINFKSTELKYTIKGIQTLYYTLCVHCIENKKSKKECLIKQVIKNIKCHNKLV